MGTVPPGESGRIPVGHPAAGMKDLLFIFVAVFLAVMAVVALVLVVLWWAGQIGPA